MISINNIKLFCQHPNKKIYEKLGKFEQELLYLYSKNLLIMQNNIKYKLAKEVVNYVECDNIYTKIHYKHIIRKLPDMLIYIQNYLKNSTIVCNITTDDGRINSCLDETLIINL